MTLLSLAVLAAESETHRELPIPPLGVGLITLFLLLGLLGALVAFGGGREHS